MQRPYQVSRGVLVQGTLLNKGKCYSRREDAPPADRPLYSVARAVATGPLSEYLILGTNMLKATDDLTVTHRRKTCQQAREPFSFRATRVLLQAWSYQRCPDATRRKAVSVAAILEVMGSPRGPLADREVGIGPLAFAMVR
jgi:hypothetical protein